MLNVSEPYNSNKKLTNVNTLDGRTIASQNSFNKNQRDKTMININSNNGNKKLYTNFKIIQNNKEIVFRLCGKKRKTLISLMTSGRNGITSLSVSSWAFRLAAYIHVLRTEFNLNIITKEEAHDGGFHARYYLLDKVEILEVKND